MTDELKALVEELCDSLEAEVRDRWGYDERLKRQLDRDMEVVNRARKLLPTILTALEALPVMREALSKIAAECWVTVGTDAQMYSRWRKLAVERVDIARAALAKPMKGQTDAE